MGSGLFRQPSARRLRTMAFSGLGSEEVALAERLTTLGQQHLFEGWAEAQGPEELAGKQKLLAQLKGIDEAISGGLEGYLSRARALLADAHVGANPLDGWKPSVPTNYSLEPGGEAFARLEEAGLKEVGRCCFVLVAGGLGERLGFSGIKVALPTETTTNVSYMELYCKQILALQARYGGGRQLPLAIMVSEDTAGRTEKLLADNNNFGMAEGQVRLLRQEKVPALLDNSARMALDGKWQVLAKPHGHGDVHALLESSGMAKQWLDEGRGWIFFLQDTNGLALHTLPALLGTSVDGHLHVNSSTVPRKPKQAIGGIVQLTHGETGRKVTVNVEYNQIDAMLRADGGEGDQAVPGTEYSPYPGNINQLLFSLEPYCKVLARTGGVMAEFVNPKYKDETKTTFKKPTRLECMMQDYPKALEHGERVGCTSIPPWLCFSPVKNSLDEARTAPVPACAGSGEADKYRVFGQLMRIAGADIAFAEPQLRAGVKVSLGPAIVLDPSFALALKELRGKMPTPDKVKVSARSTLVLRGEGIVLEALDLDGALCVRACPGARVVVRGLTVRNAGWDFVDLKDGESAVELLAMRGYEAVMREQQDYEAVEPGEYLLSDAGLTRT